MEDYFLNEESMYDDELYRLMDIILREYENGKTIGYISQLTGLTNAEISELLKIIYTEKGFEEKKREQMVTSRIKSSKSSSTGIYRVTFVHQKNRTPRWRYQYKEMDKLKTITSKNLYDLKMKVLDKGLDWEEFSEESKQKVEDSKKEYYEMKENESGFYRVKKIKADTAQGFTWIYSFTKNKKFNSVSSVNLDTLKKKVLEKGWEWREE